MMYTVKCFCFMASPILETPMILILGNYQHMTRSVFPHIAKRLKLNTGWYVDPAKAKARLDQVVFWNPHSVLSCREDSNFHDLFGDYLASGKKIVNQRFIGCSKSTLDCACLDVFGRGLQINPVTFDGFMVEKSPINARHDGRILKGPLTPEQVDSRKMYLRLIDNRKNSREIEDLRVPVYGGLIGHGWLKTRPIESRFGVQARKASPVWVPDLLSSEELGKLQALAKALQLDFGEFDVLRDRTTDQIWVCDVNNCPSPISRNAMHHKVRSRLFLRLADLYRDAFRLPRI